MAVGKRNEADSVVNGLRVSKAVVCGNWVKLRVDHQYQLLLLKH